MATGTIEKRSLEHAVDSCSLEEILDEVRDTYGVIEGSPSVERARLRVKLKRAVTRVRTQLEREIARSMAVQAEKSGPTEREQFRRPDASIISLARSRFPEPSMRVYAKDLARHALSHIPRLNGLESTAQMRTYLSDNLRFNSEATRRRNASYLISRYFPGDSINSDLPAFAAAFEGTPMLADALFYLSCRAERILALVAEDVVFPSLALGGVSRIRIRDFVGAHLPDSKSASQVAAAIVATYQGFGVATATRARLTASLREGDVAAFAYVLHLEFPEPGMYSFDRLFSGPMHKWLLWDQQWMVRQLYELRETGLLSKVSDIDRMRQFTTRYSLAEAIQPIVALAGQPHT